MFDARLRKVIDPPLNRIAAYLASTGIRPDAITFFGFGLGIGASALIAFGFTGLALIPLLLSRIADGLDGAVARASEGPPSAHGGFLDITLDFIFYGTIPFAFAVMDPADNALAAGFLILSFYANGSAFLAFAVLAEQQKAKTSMQGHKSLYYVSGLLEGGETIAFFAILCLFPGWFAPLAWGFGFLCFVSAALRIVLAMRMFR